MILGSIVLLLLVIGGITLYRTYALYKEEKSFDVIQGKVPSFLENDVKVAVLVDGEKSNDFPENNGNNIGYEVECDNEATGEWNNTKWSLEITNLKKNKTTCTVKFSTSKKLNDIVIAKSKESKSVEKFEHEATEQTPALIDYRYVGANPNNYVYFGCDTNCTEDDLYRIIGIMPTQSEENGTYENRVKLIRNNYYYENKSGYFIDADSSLLTILPVNKGYNWYRWQYNNDWEKSPLFNSVLNEVFWQELGENQKYIASSIWYMGAVGYNMYRELTPTNYYTYERGDIKGTSGGDLYAVANIGLMYPSDLGYSIGKEYLNKSIVANKIDYTQNSWLSIEYQYHEWTLMPESGDIENPSVYGATSDGSIYPYPVNFQSMIQEIRPTFYLKENVLYESGTGTLEKPYRITLS